MAEFSMIVEEQPKALAGPHSATLRLLREV